MKKGKFQRAPAHSGRKRLIFTLVSILLVAACSVGGTLALFSGISGAVTNTFKAGSVGADIQETVSNNTKKSITVYNSGGSPVYVRVRLVSYWVDAQGNVAPKSSALNPSINSAWKQIGDYYYYKAPVAGTTSTGNLLAADLALGEESNYKQVIEVLAETVQATPAQAVSDVWGVTPAQITG